MNEDEYRTIYNQLNPQDCVYKKITLFNYGNCEHGEKKYLAERETMACQSKKARLDCLQLLNKMRDNARFALKITKSDAPLPHSKEMRVQVAGIYGLQQHLDNNNTADTEQIKDNVIYNNLSGPPIKNVHGVVKDAVLKYGKIKDIPYNELVKAIMRFSLPRRKKRKDTL